MPATNDNTVKMPSAIEYLRWYSANRLTQAFSAFQNNPSADQWQALQVGMLRYQQAQQLRDHRHESEVEMGLDLLIEKVMLDGKTFEGTLVEEARRTIARWEGQDDDIDF